MCRYRESHQQLHKKYKDKVLEVNEKMTEVVLRGRNTKIVLELGSACVGDTCEYCGQVGHTKSTYEVME